MATSGYIAHCCTCSKLHLNSYCSHVIIIKMQSSIIIPSLKLESKVSTRIPNVEWGCQYSGNLGWIETFATNASVIIRAVNITVPSESQVYTVAEVEITVRVSLCPPITISKHFKIIN